VELAAQANHPLHPVQQRERGALLRFDVDRLVAVNRIHDRRRIEPRRIRAREPAVAVAGPLHRRAHAVAIAEIDVVPHPELVAVINDWRPRHREQQAVQQLDAAPAVLEQRRQATPDADVDAHLRVGGVGLIHVVPFLVGHHLERELVVVAEEHRPLAVLRDVRRLPQDLDDGMPVLLPHRHEHARHQREVERHVAFVAVAEVGADVGRPLIRLGEEHAAGVARVERLPDLLEDVVRLGQVLADRALALDQVRHRIEPQPVDAAIEPEPHHADDRVEHPRVVEVQVRLVMEEPVPVVGLRGVVPAPVGGLGVREDDPDPFVFAVGVAPDVEVPLGGAGRRPARGLEPRVLIRRVVDDELGDDADVAAVRFGDHAVEIGERAVARVDVLVVRDVVAVVAQRRGVERQQPQGIDAKPLQVFHLLRQPGEVADAVVGAVEERAHVRLIDDGIFVPVRIVARGRLRSRLNVGS
jgi:hypothetical protein